jgi:hypothetical protein
LTGGRPTRFRTSPNGSRKWRYNYRFQGKHGTLALEIYPNFSLEKARARHQIERSLLADDIDPSIRKRVLSIYSFATLPEDESLPDAIPNAESSKREDENLRTGI